MGLFTYSPNIPNRPDAPKNDQPFMQQNSQSIGEWVTIDHVGFNIPSTGGLHNQVTFALNQANPGIQTGVSALYSQVISGSPYPFWSQGATAFPLAGPNSLATQGYSYLLRGLIVQWGFVNGTHGGDGHFNNGEFGTVTFATSGIAFPNNCFNVWTNARYLSGNVPNSAASVTTASDTLSKTKFDWSIFSSSGDYTSFVWIALGN